MTDLGGSELPITALIKATNVNFTNGWIEKAPGAIRYNVSGGFTAGVVACQDYWPTILSQRMIVATSDGKIWKDYGDRGFNNMVPIATGIASGKLDNTCQIVIAGNEAANNVKKVFIFSNGKAQIQVISGDSQTVGAIGSPATDWPNPSISSNPQSIFPKFGIVHRNRLWCFMKSQYYASSATNHEDFQTSNAILTGSMGPGQGGDILGGIVYKSRLYVIKEGDLIYQLNDTDASSTNWYFTLFAQGLGVSSIHALVQVIDDLIIGNNTGALTSYTATQAYGDVKQGDIFKNARVSKYFREYTSKTGIPFMHAIYYSEKGLALFSTRSTFTTFNDTIIQLDVSNPQTPKFGLWNHYQADCLSLRRDSENIMRPMYGAKDGYVYLASRETRAVNGAAYTAEFKIPYFDMRHLDPTMSAKDKQFDFLSCTFTPDGNHSLNVDVYIDGRFNETVSITQTIDTNYLGAFKLGTSILGVEEEQTVIVPLHGMGKRISLRCYNGNALESFKVSQLSIGFKVNGENSVSLPGQGG